MKLTRAIGAVGASLVGLGAINAVLETRARPLDPPLGIEPSTYRWRGIDVSVTRAGDPDDPDIVLLHDIHVAGTSREFHEIVHRLAEEYHVIAPDLPGFGRSERPPLVYSARLYEDFVREFLRDEADTPICLGIGLTGAYALVADAEVDLRQLVLLAPTAETSSRDHWFARGSLRLPILGTGVFNLLTTKPALRRWLDYRSVATAATLSEDDITYFWQTAHQAGARYAPASLLSGILDPAIELGAALAETDTPTTLVWGRDASHPPVRDGRRLAETGACKLVVIDRAKVSPHLDQPDAALEVLTEEISVP